MDDMRFPNEADAIKARGGFLVKIIRPDMPGLLETHVSEAGLDYRTDWDLVVVNQASSPTEFVTTWAPLVLDTTAPALRA